MLRKTAETTTKIVLGEADGAVSHTTREQSRVTVHFGGSSKDLTQRGLDELIAALQEIRTCLPGCAAAVSR
jgi:hypothetical protein